MLPGDQQFTSAVERPRTGPTESHKSLSPWTTPFFTLSSAATRLHPRTKNETDINTFNACPRR
jgi:hypothetical protein